MFGTSLSSQSLSLLCRSLATMLQAGVALTKAFDLAAGQSHNPAARAALKDVSIRMRSGEDVASALRAQSPVVPELVIDMVAVAEQTGFLPEVLRGLADHYENLHRLRRSFLTAMAWPGLQFVAAILIIALLIFVLGIIAESNNTVPVDFLGFGLTGTSGAIAWLTMTFGTIAAGFVVWQILQRSPGGLKSLDSVLLNIPVVGNCRRSFAIARFSWAFALTQQGGMPVRESLDISLRATSNGQFQAAAPQMIAQVMGGDELHEALAASRLFPADYLHMVEVAETSGTVPEMLQHLSPQFEDQAHRSLAAMATAAGWGVWLLVAVFIIYMIFSMFTTFYLNPIREHL